MTKSNSKQVVACCLLLAAKMNESHKMSFKKLINELEDMFINKKKILEMEFSVYVELKFNLLLPDNVVSSHIPRLLTLIGKSIDDV